VSIGAQPLYGVKHSGGDAIFALACNYPKDYYMRFVGSLRKFGYDGDIVLAVSPPEKMHPGVGDYIKVFEKTVDSFFFRFLFLNICFMDFYEYLKPVELLFF
jgi:hypothetical protein